jgi:dTMP kinase
MDVIRNFVVFEGGDGSGTSTQLALLKKRFDAGGPQGSLPQAGLPQGGNPPLFLTAEPTDGPVGRLIRAALKGEAPLLPETLARLFAADRGEHLNGPNGIRERAGRGELVVCDRYIPSSMVYQGLECGEELPRILNSPFPVPELILCFDLERRVAAERIKNRPEREIYEYLDFQVKVRDRYHLLLPVFRGQGSQVIQIDAAASPDNVADQVWDALKNLPIMRG